METISQNQNFYPSTNDSQFLWAGLMSNLKSAFKKAQRANCRVGKIFIFLETQNQNFQVRSVRLKNRVSSPHLIKADLKQAFLKLYNPRISYQATSCQLTE